MPSENDGVMIVLSSPSGAGKTTLVKMLSNSDNFEISISHTTRKPRPNEVDGIDYYFISNKKFKELIKKGKFYEYAKIFENYYGTLKESVDQMIKKNDIFFAIKGKKNDGNKFVSEAFKKKSSLTILNRINQKYPLKRQR